MHLLDCGGCDCWEGVKSGRHKCLLVSLSPFNIYPQLGSGLKVDIVLGFSNKALGISFGCIIGNTIATV